MSFYDDLRVIQSAVYGKEVRPAIADALMTSWSAIKAMTESVDELNARVDNLSGGGTIDPDNPDAPTSVGCVVVGGSAMIVDGLITAMSSVGDADKF